MQEIFTHLICIYLKAKLHMFIVHLQLGKATNCKFYAEKSKIENHKMSHSLDLIIQWW